MENFFGEKTIQVEPFEIKAFGISVFSRYGKANEIIEMMNFAKRAATRNVAGYVTKLDYDSQSQCCVFTLAPSVHDFSEIADQIRTIAKSTIRQFVWFDSIEHGADYNEE